MDKKIITAGIIILAAISILIFTSRKSTSTTTDKAFDSLTANLSPLDETHSSEVANSSNVSNRDTAVNNNLVSPSIDPNYQKIMYATVKTNLGDIKIQLFGDKVPLTAGNFAKLAESGFYNGTKFHRVIKNFMVQGGDPLTKNDSLRQQWGTGGPGYQFNDEPFEGEYTRGTLAMANAGPNTNGSQFFIMHQDTPLPKSYVIFGKVVTGLEVVDKNCQFAY